MDHIPLCFYGIQGDLQCTIFKKKETENVLGAFNAQGQVERTKPFNTIHIGPPQPPLEPNIETHAPVQGILYRNDPTFIGMYKNANPNTTKKKDTEQRAYFHL